MEEKILLDILGLSSSQSEVGHFALVMGEVEGNRRLPIIIDGFQARAIALEIENIKPNRPMTHDLIVSIAKTFGLELLEVIITELREGIFYARLIFEANGKIHEIDSRTSDAVAIGVRFKVPIYTYEAVLAVAGIEVTDEEEDDELPGSAEMDEEFPEMEGEEEQVELEDLAIPDRIRRLNTLIEEALSNEEYEEAAKYRDEINRLEGENN